MLSPSRPRPSRAREHADMLRRFSSLDMGERCGSAEFISSVGGPERMRTWQILYCGGAQPVVDALNKVSKAYGISLEIEKFDW